MTDVHDKLTRSYNMSMIKGKDTKPELYVRKYLHSKGFRFRLHNAKLPGKPDIVLSKYNTVIFINGCFWHGHEDCRYFKLPATNREKWEKKIRDTKKRDRDAIGELSSLGWKVIVIWECQLKPKERERILHNLIKSIIGNEIY